MVQAVVAAAFGRSCRHSSFVMKSAAAATAVIGKKNFCWQELKWMNESRFDFCALGEGVWKKVNFIWENCLTWPSLLHIWDYLIVWKGKIQLKRLIGYWDHLSSEMKRGCLHVTHLSQKMTRRQEKCIFNFLLVDIWKLITCWSTETVKFQVNNMLTLWEDLTTLKSWTLPSNWESWTGNRLHCIA